MSGFIDKEDIAVARKEGAEMLARLRDRIRTAQECVDEINELRGALSEQVDAMERAVRCSWKWPDMPEEAIYEEVPGLHVVHRFYSQASDRQLRDATVDVPAINHFEALFENEATAPSDF